MIIVKTRLGLGNQMLQYALGRHLSIKHKTELFLDTSWYANNPDLPHPREFGLDKFCTKYQVVDFKQLKWRLKFTGHGRKLNPFRLPLVKEKDFYGFDPTLLETGNNTILEGFFTSYKYFDAIRSQLLQDFMLKEALDKVNASMLHRIRETNSVSLHIRRGDYASTEYHGILPAGYYERAIELIAHKKGAVQLFVFSDEPQWVKENMAFGFPTEIIDFNSDQKNYLDMELMKHCKHNIIANSTFSWWPAWLNENDGKIVVAPERWYNQVATTSAHLPLEWHVL